MFSCFLTITLASNHVFKFFQSCVIGQEMDMRSVGLWCNTPQLILICIICDTNCKNFIVSFPKFSCEMARVCARIWSSICDEEYYFVCFFPRFWRNLVKDFAQRCFCVRTTSLKMNVPWWKKITDYSMCMMWNYSILKNLNEYVRERWWYALIDNGKMGIQYNTEYNTLSSVDLVVQTLEKTERQATKNGWIAWI